MTDQRAREFDAQMMDIALAMAWRGVGQTAPNPSVGAIVVDEKSGEILGRGWTQSGGRPHAEPVALEVAGVSARGATLYVTLEPCSHFGQTPPCVSAILSAGIARVVCGVTDPDPRVSGRGLDQLKQAGVEIVRNVRLDEARWVTRGHVLRVSQRRPFVQLKLALGKDGRIALGNAGEPVWVTSVQARAHGALLRAQADAILVGAGTLHDDNPDLRCRLPGLSDRSPLRVVLAGNRPVPLSAKVFETAEHVPVKVFYSDASLMAGAHPAGVDVQLGQTVSGRLWLPAVLEALTREGVTRLLVEGGPGMWRAFGAAGLVDEVVVYRADSLDGDITATVVGDVMHYVPNTDLKIYQARRIGDDHIIRLRPS
ncbi:MAG: bifunctional diaminohydroxyphosphoribosylaminopyrimidine deaminase/5-amino-6-(5-phosphoribosylamino)uracil reductase RibD [Hyphomicrobiaceae bacterium]